MDDWKSIKIFPFFSSLSKYKKEIKYKTTRVSADCNEHAKFYSYRLIML